MIQCHNHCHFHALQLQSRIADHSKTIAFQTACRANENTTIRSTFQFCPRRIHSYRDYMHKLEPRSCLMGADHVLVSKAYAEVKNGFIIQQQWSQQYPSQSYIIIHAHIFYFMLKSLFKIHKFNSRSHFSNFLYIYFRSILLYSIF